MARALWPDVEKDRWSRSARRAGADPVRLGRFRLAPLTLEQAAAWIVDAALREQACIVITPNIHHLRLAEVDARFRSVIGASALNVADGWPLVALSRLLGTPLPERVAGIDLVDRVLTSAPRLRPAILGGPPGAAAALAARIADRHEVALVDPLAKGTWNTDTRLEALARRVREARPNLVLLGIGAPWQELLSARLRKNACGPIINCGAAIEVLAGYTPRAPELLRRTGLEWAWRLGNEPRRLAPRYLVAAGWLVRVAGHEVALRLRGHRS